MSEMTPEQKADNERAKAETKAMLAKIESGVSPCCDAPLDLSRVIQSGPRKGHGKRFCSKCRRWVFTV